MKRIVLPLLLLTLLAGCYMMHSGKFSVSMSVEKKPILAGKAANELIYIAVYTTEMRRQIAVTGIELNFSQGTMQVGLSSITIFHKKEKSGPFAPELFGTSQDPQVNNSIA